MEIFLGFYIGSMSMILLYNIYWYGVTKEKSYFYYAGFKAFLILIILQNYSLVEIPPFFLILNANIVFVLMLLFSKEFLELKSGFNRIKHLLNSLIVFVLVCFIYSLLSGNFEIYDQPYSLVISPLILIGVYVYRKGSKPAKYYSIAWAASLFLIGLSDLNKFDVIDFYPEIPFDPIGNIVESVIISYAISVKTRLIIEEKEQQSTILTHQARLASMGHMLENISHQWRQPLNRISTILINIRMALSDSGKNKAEFERRLLDCLEQSQLQLEYMSNTISDFTDFNKQEQDKENFTASSAVDRVHDIIGKSLVSNNILFDVDDEDDFFIYSYKNELAQVLLNLIQNAQDALLKRQISQPRIKVSIQENMISVLDNAGGVDAEILDQIFEPYFTTKSKTTSLGLGLYMSKIILDKYFDAKIVVEQGDGSTSFDIVFINTLEPYGQSGFND